ncbi:hypothetical protein [Microcoleus sp. herbarium12]|uniref:hypothetical protein n=1 Tax=Microcoleus sp. herbarium12 TaxID=3055437 RepID=UPI002FD13C4A
MRSNSPSTTRGIRGDLASDRSEISQVSSDLSAAGDRINTPNLSDRAIDKFTLGKQHCRIQNAI